MTIAAQPREGVVFSAELLEQSCASLLAALLPAYGVAVADQLGWSAAPAPPRSYTCSAQLDRFAEDQLPAVVIVSPGTIGVPELHSGTYDAVYGLVVGVYCSASTDRATHDLVRLWCAALRACLLQSPSLGGVASGLRFVDESYDQVDIEARRSLGAGICGFEARVNAIVDATAGPLTGLDPPDGGPWPTVHQHRRRDRPATRGDDRMSRYVNTRGHAIDLPDGTLVAAGESRRGRRRRGGGGARHSRHSARRARGRARQDHRKKEAKS